MLPILLSYFLEMTDREISEKLNIVHQTVSKRLARYAERIARISNEGGI